MNMMGLAVEDYHLHQQEVKVVLTNLEKIYEYEKNRPQNDITTKMWEKLKDSSGNLLGGFVSRWRREGQLNALFIDNSRSQVSEAFNRIAQLESKKIKK